jgi:AraC-like DNA-binding protein
MFEPVTSSQRGFVRSDLDAGWRNRLAPAVAEMTQHMSKAHTLASLAVTAGVSRSAFAIGFRATFGRSPMEFLGSIRLQEASRLLRSTGLPVKVIATRVGYESRSSFANAFRRAFGTSPGDFRDAEATSPKFAIQKVAERLRRLSHDRQEICWEVDIVTGKVWWSDATFFALGYDSRRRLISDVAHFHERIHPDDRHCVVESMEAACIGDELIWRSNFRFRKADNTHAYIKNACVILRNASGAPTRLIGVMKPTTSTPDLDQQS